jgi:amidase
VLDHAPGEQYLDDPECRAAVASTARLLESLGHQVEESAPAAMFEPEFATSFFAIIGADVEATFQAFETLFLGRPITDDEIEPRNAVHRAVGRAMSATQYLQARAFIGQWTRRMAEWWTTYDLLLTPTLGGRPPELGWFTAVPEDEGNRIVSMIPYTAQFNMTGQPAISLPLHWTPDGLPVGVQLVARYGREDVLVRIASQLEQAAPWADKHPPEETA